MATCPHLWLGGSNCLFGLFLNYLILYADVAVVYEVFSCIGLILLILDIFLSITTLYVHLTVSALISTKIQITGVTAFTFDASLLVPIWFFELEVCYSITFSHNKEVPDIWDDIKFRSFRNLKRTLLEQMNNLIWSWEQPSFES